MRTTSNPIPDHIRPIVAIGSTLPPFTLVIMVFLWAKLNSDTAVILPILGYCLLTLVPLLLNLVVQRKFADGTLPGHGLLVALLFWALAVLPLFGTMASLNNIDVQLALALPVVLISGFYTSSIIYLVSAIICAHFIKRAAVK
jgi:hypothetical protein